MALELRQSLKMTQQLVMTPQLQQAIKLLQLSRPELLESINSELMENPVLEMNEGQGEQPEGDQSDEVPRTEASTNEVDATDQMPQAAIWGVGWLR